LDENDSDLARFLAYLIAALQVIEPDLGAGAADILQTAQTSIEDVLTLLINDIAAISDRIILVLDDYHLLESSAVDDSLVFMLEHFPPQMHLVIATRDDPHLPLARLRARGQLTELRAVDLRFVSPEAAEFLNQVMDLGLSVEDVAALESRTEGWIAGLQLAAISMQGHEDASSLVKAFTGSHRFVLDYLIEEVLERQPQDIQAFLLKTAILDRLTGSLCDALTGQDDGQATLEALEQVNLFVVALDDQRRWYRYHHLFADLLRQRLNQTHQEQIVDLHGRASEWHERNGRPADSIRHAIAAQDLERAADLAELAWPAYREGMRSITWLSWLEKLPDDLVRARPVLCAGYAWAFLNRGDLEAAEARLRDVERWLEPVDDVAERAGSPLTTMVVVDREQFQSLPVSLAAARAYHAQATGDVARTVKYARRVLNLLPESDQQWGGAASSLLGLALLTSGDMEGAYRSLSSGLASMDPIDAISGTFVLAEIRKAQGQLRAATAICEQSLRIASEHGPPMPLGTEDVYSARGELYREQGDLKAAEQDLLTAKSVGDAIELPDWQHRWCIAQARLLESLGDTDAALDLLDQAQRVFVRTPVPKLRPIAAMKARLWLKQGRLAEAQSWASERELAADDDLSYLREFEHITLSKILVAQYRNDPLDDSIHQALELLARLLHVAEEERRTGSVIEILVQQALAHQALDDIPIALESLQRAMIMAEPEGYFRLFVDEGLPMARLLREAFSQGLVPDYSRRLLVAFSVAETEHPISSRRRIPESERFEPLSERETEVLQLISEGLTNQEIATRLYLSLNTVKVHTRNIYSKLGVHHRTGAVARARALGILPDA
jgi:LuxR family maltose regulon positive regulatory protein